MCLSALFPGGSTWREKGHWGPGTLPGPASWAGSVAFLFLGYWLSLKNPLPLCCTLKTRNIAESNLKRLEFVFMKRNLYFISIFLNLIHRFGAVPTKISASYSEEIDNMSLKRTQKFKGCRTRKTFKREKTLEDLLLISRLTIKLQYLQQHGIDTRMQ